MNRHLTLLLLILMCGTALWGADIVTFQIGTTALGTITDTAGSTITFDEKGSISHIPKKDISGLYYNGCDLTVTSEGKTISVPPKIFSDQFPLPNPMQPKRSASAPTIFLHNGDTLYQFGDSLYIKAELAKRLITYRTTAQKGQKLMAIGYPLAIIGVPAAVGGFLSFFTSALSQGRGKEAGTSLLICVIGIAAGAPGIALATVGTVQYSTGSHKANEAQKILSTSLYLTPTGGGICGTF